MGVWYQMWLIEAKTTWHPVGPSAAVTSQPPFSLHSRRRRAKELQPQRFP